MRNIKQEMVDREAFTIGLDRFDVDGRKAQFIKEYSELITEDGYFKNPEFFFQATHNLRFSLGELLFATFPFLKPQAKNKP